MALFLLLLFCLASIYPTLVPYRRYLKDHLWWTRAWTPHALVVCSMSLFLRLLDHNQVILDLLSGVLVILSGFGLIFIFSIYLIENRQLLFPPISRSLIIVFHHLLMGLIGLWLISSTKLNTTELYWSLLLLTIYAILIFPKGFDVPFILYEKSHVSINKRRRVFQLITAVIFLILPLSRLQI